MAIKSAEKSLRFSQKNSTVLNEHRKPVSSIKQVRLGDQIITCIEDGELISKIVEARDKFNESI